MRRLSFLVVVNGEEDVVLWVRFGRVDFGRRERVEVRRGRVCGGAWKNCYQWYYTIIKGQ